MKGRKVDWSDVDWSKTNAQIGRERGVTRQGVEYARKKLGKPEPHRPVMVRDALVRLAKERDTSTMRISEIAREVGSVQSHVRREVEKLGMEYRRGRVRKVEDWSGVDWSKTDAAIGEELGVSKQSANDARKKYGKPRPRINKAKVALLALAEERDIGQMTLREACTELGLHRLTAHNAAKSLGLQFRDGRGIRERKEW